MLAAVAQWIRHWSADSEIASSTPARNLEKKLFFFVIPSVNNYKNWRASINLHAQM